jgi:hypothetical protein
MIYGPSCSLSVRNLALHSLARFLGLFLLWLVYLFRFPVPALFFTPAPFSAPTPFPHPHSVLPLSQTCSVQCLFLLICCLAYLPVVTD